MEFPTFVPWIIIAAVVLPLLLTGSIVFLAVRAMQRNDARRQALLASGEPAEATVMKTNYTGTRIGGRTQVATRLEVRRPGHQPYQTTVYYYLDGMLYSQTPLYPPGTIVQVRVDPGQPQHVAIVGPAGFPATGGLFGGAPGAPPQVTTSNLFVVNGRSYTSLAEMPADVRQAFEGMQGMIGDANNNGLPDLLENLGGLASGGGQAATGPTVNLAASGSPSERLAELKRMFDQGLINTQEYEAKKAEILRGL